MAYDLGKASVLIVEDNQPMIELIKSVLTTLGFKTIHVARDGEDGFQAFCRYNPDLVISDWMMTPTNGIEMAHKIRQDARSPNKYVPIILLTGHSQKKRVIEARDTGITEFIVKPFKVHDLYRRIENIIELPRKFVNADDFFGPDRRRRKNMEFRGPFQRDDDFQKKKDGLEKIHKEDSLYKDLMREQNQLEEQARKDKDPLIIDIEDRDD